MRSPFSVAAVLLLFCALVPASDQPSDPKIVGKPGTNEFWITGDLYIQNKVLFFRADKPIKGNSSGNVTLLGTTKQNAQSVLPILMKAAEKKMKLRLFGVLQPAKGSFPGYTGPKLPTVQFIVWKIHMPTDPDELPPDQRIPIQ